MRRLSLVLISSCQISSGKGLRLGAGRVTTSWPVDSTEPGFSDQPAMLVNVDWSSADSG
jgi:hypothetical protein